MCRNRWREELETGKQARDRIWEANGKLDWRRDGERHPTQYKTENESECNKSPDMYTALSLWQAISFVALCSLSLPSRHQNERHRLRSAAQLFSPFYLLSVQVSQSSVS